LQQYPLLFDDDQKWREKAEEFSHRVMEFTSFMNTAYQEKVLRTARSVNVYYHEPCHLRFDAEKSGKAQLLLKSIDNVSLVNPDKGQQCCGQGGLFHLGYPELSEEIFALAYNLFRANEVDVVLTTCAGCLMQWQAGLANHGSAVKAVHLAVWLRSCMQINS
jgi:glycolate oxidase iron-sulfur subunit